MAQADYEIGRVIDAFRQTGELDNTLIIYIAGDNGASLEGSLNGTDNVMELVNGLQTPAAEVLRRLDDIGGPMSNPHYPVGWAWAGNTPFQWGKRIGSHLGGTRDPLVVSWPARIRDAGATRAHYTHVIDLFPTILQAAQVTPPQSVDGVPQQVIDGISFFDVLASGTAPERHTQQYFELHGNRSIYQDGWVAAQRSGLLAWTNPSATAPPPPWELYDLTRDYSEANNLAGAEPARLEALKQTFDAVAARNKVFPIDPRFAERVHPNPPPPGGRDFYTFYPGATHLFDATAPGTRNRSHTLTAFVEIPSGGADGVLVADGGNPSGYTLYIKNGRPAYTYNYFRREITTVTATDPLPSGNARIDVRFAYEGGGEGKGATVTLAVNGQQVGEAHLAHTVPRIYTYDETFDVGEDSATPVGPYAAPFPFTGTLQRIELRASPTAR
jgi:arylsulfatase